jgi:hypothetical protein
MGNLLRSLLVVALVLAVTPFASAQRVAAQNAAELSDGGGVVQSEYVPLPTPVPENRECYSNGPLFNRPGTGGRPFESVLVGDETTFGYGAQRNSAGVLINNEMADDYVVRSDCSELKGSSSTPTRPAPRSPPSTGSSSTSTAAM